MAVRSRLRLKVAFTTALGLSFQSKVNNAQHLISSKSHPSPMFCLITTEARYGP